MVVLLTIQFVRELSRVFSRIILLSHLLTTKLVLSEHWLTESHNDFRNLTLILRKNLFPLSVINKIINFYLTKKQNHTERTDNAQKRQSVSLHYFK